MRSVTYLTVQGQTRTGYYEGIMHKQTGELLVVDTKTESPQFVKPDRVTFTEV